MDFYTLHSLQKIPLFFMKLKLHSSTSIWFTHTHTQTKSIQEAWAELFHTWFGQDNNDFCSSSGGITIMVRLVRFTPTTKVLNISFNVVLVMTKEIYGDLEILWLHNFISPLRDKCGCRCCDLWVGNLWDWKSCSFTMNKETYS
jgi:hypothetical protein